MPVTFCNLLAIGVILKALGLTGEEGTASSFWDAIPAIEDDRLQHSFPHEIGRNGWSACDQSALRFLRDAELAGPTDFGQPVPYAQENRN